ncbi:MAG: hypothetical protein KTR21_15075 [Rhodobacteraceae bacterium]|nr:hypothetical protein [Paracoccaceae bacterium]
MADKPTDELCGRYWSDRLGGPEWPEEADISPAEASLRRLIANRGDCVHKLKAKDATGRWACYFVFVEPDREREFLDDLRSERVMDLCDYGIVIASNYGEGPSRATCRKLRKRFGFDIKRDGE